MKTVKILLVVITVCEACRSSVKPEVTITTKPPKVTTEKVASYLPLPIPNPKYITIHDGGRVTVAWDPVKVTQDHPIVGLKIKLWDPEKHKVYKYAEVNGTSVLTEEWVPVDKPFHEVPKHKPAFEAVLPPDALEAHFIVIPGEEYEIRGQSYNNDGDGPYSTPTGFQIHKDNI